MTNPEFSNEFDVLYNNIMSNQAPGLDEYEKSVFLTKAQDEILKNYFNPKGNKYQEGFDGNEKRQIDFSSLMRTFFTDNVSTSGSYDNRAKSIEMPTDAMLIINEVLYVQRGDDNITLNVIPITYSEYSRLMSKPYKRPLKNQAWRIITNTLTKKQADVIAGPSDTIQSYSARYIKFPKAIILTDLEGVTIDGKNTAQECELDPILHQEILQRAVELAKAAYIGDLNSSVELGKRSE